MPSPLLLGQPELTKDQKMNTSESPRVLVAEDNHVMGNVLRFNFQRAGFDITLAHDGRVALELLKEQEFDLVITDYQMPFANGDEICRFIRSDERLKDIPVVLVTAKGMELQSEESLIGPDRFSKLVYKPFSPLEIVRVANDILQPV